MATWHDLRIQPNDDTFSWINVSNWHKVDIGVLGVDEFPVAENMFGRCFEDVDHILFQDERDAIMFKLSLK